MEREALCHHQKARLPRTQDGVADLTEPRRLPVNDLPWPADLSPGKPEESYSSLRTKARCPGFAMTAPLAACGGCRKVNLAVAG